ncbi:MAG: type II toxin-antitoxin system RelE/ParE family toxin [Candidatus Hydrogenedentes bacterium]|nr:type II toxin-antitoxin system RelE/ParE family toxin [Candidatus Hydrogenedentota bacterium]
MFYTFHPEALREMIQASRYLRDSNVQLAQDFLNEVERGLKGVLDSPSTWPYYRGNVRRYLIHRFPYAILYNVKSDHVLVNAVMHLHRRPECWKRREVD